MRFHATLKHTAESCPVFAGGNPNPVPDWPARAKEVGVELIAVEVCAPAHVHFFVVETDDYSKLTDLFRPYMVFATADITPVRSQMNPR